MECNNTLTHCDLSDLRCGQTYSVSVFAVDDSCSSAVSDKAYVKTGMVSTFVSESCQYHCFFAHLDLERKKPSYCVFETLRLQLFCHINLSCCYNYFGPNNNNNAVLFSSPLPLSLSSSAPCAPQDVHVEAQCADGAMVVSWSANPDAEYFHVEAVSNTGARHHCNNSGTACTIANLPCGRSYNLSVLSVRGGCEGKPSAVVETSTGKAVVCSLVESKTRCDGDLQPQFKGAQSSKWQLNCAASG